MSVSWDLGVEHNEGWRALGGLSEVGMCESRPVGDT